MEDHMEEGFLEGRLPFRHELEDRLIPFGCSTEILNGMVKQMEEKNAGRQVDGRGME